VSADWLSEKNSSKYSTDDSKYKSKHHENTHSCFKYFLVDKLFLLAIFVFCMSRLNNLIKGNVHKARC